MGFTRPVHQEEKILGKCSPGKRICLILDENKVLYVVKIMKIELNAIWM